MNHKRKRPENGRPSRLLGRPVSSVQNTPMDTSEKAWPEPTERLPAGHED